MDWSEEQKNVIEARDSSLLVSAAAGSGKTAVLVERIIGRITDPADPVSLDEYKAAVESAQTDKDKKRVYLYATDVFWMIS